MLEVTEFLKVCKTLATAHRSKRGATKSMPVPHEWSMAHVGFIPTKVRNFLQSSQLPAWEFRREKDGFTSASAHFRRKPLFAPKISRKLLSYQRLSVKESAAKNGRFLDKLISLRIASNDLGQRRGQSSTNCEQF
jgi:hypothetical protein